MKAIDIIQKFKKFYKEKGHVEIPNAPLIPENDPTTLFTSSGMQPLIPYLAGEVHPQGKKFVNVQNCFRGQGALDDIDEVGDNRHLTFFRMMGNWSLGDYFKKEQLNFMFEYLTQTLKINPEKLYVSTFEGYQNIPKDEESINIWIEIFKNAGIDSKNRIIQYGPKKNWWSRAGGPENMPEGELGGPDSEIFYDFGEKLKIHENSIYKNEKCHINCDCGRYIEISNNVFMQYKKNTQGNFDTLPQKNVDHGSGLERLIMATENQPDVFKTSLFYPIIQTLEKELKINYDENIREMRMITAHLSSSVFIVSAGITPSNKEQGYILRRLIRRATDSFNTLKGQDLTPIIASVIGAYKDTDPILVEKFEEIKNVILEEQEKYQKTKNEAKKYIQKKYPSIHPKQTIGDEVFDEKKEISAEDAFILYTTHGLSPTQIKSLGYVFNDQDFAEKIKVHKALSKTASVGMFKGGLIDHSELTIKGHTATHLLQQAIRDLLGNNIHQIGSNITPQRLRFDFNFDRKLTDEEILKLEEKVREKINQALPVHFEILPLETAKKIEAIGLFDEKYEKNVKIYFIGGSGKDGDHMAYSKEFCGGPHVKNTSEIKSFKITKQEKIGTLKQRIYAVIQ